MEKLEEIDKKSLDKCLVKECDKKATHLVDRDINDFECELHFCKEHAEQFEEIELKRIIQSRK